MLAKGRGRWAVWQKRIIRSFKWTVAVRRTLKCFCTIRVYPFFFQKYAYCLVRLFDKRGLQFIRDLSSGRVAAKDSTIPPEIRL